MKIFTNDFFDHKVIFNKIIKLLLNFYLASEVPLSLPERSRSREEIPIDGK
jgi:hypothetical protein